jgi:hypothetical protein
MNTVLHPGQHQPTVSSLHISMANVEVVELGKSLSIKLCGDCANGFSGVVRSSTWDAELRKIERTQAAGTPAGQPYVM